MKLLSVPDRGDRLFFSVFARFIDIGKEEEVKSHQILQLPEQFHSLPDQAVEIIVCRVKPTDAETNWHPKVSCSSTHSALKTQQSCALHQLAELLIIMHLNCRHLSKHSRTPPITTTLQQETGEHLVKMRIKIKKKMQLHGASCPKLNSGSLQTE